MPEILSMKSLRAAVKNGSVDTVIAAFRRAVGIRPTASARTRHFRLRR